MDVPAGVTQEEGNTGFSIHLLSAVLALIFLCSCYMCDHTYDYSAEVVSSILDKNWDLYPGFRSGERENVSIQSLVDEV